jgi:hypothetical protein
LSANRDGKPLPSLVNVDEYVDQKYVEQAKQEKEQLRIEEKATKAKRRKEQEQLNSNKPKRNQVS